MAASTLQSDEPAGAARARPTLRPRPWLAAISLCRREWVRFVRQPNRVFGAVGTPVLFWLLFGAGLGPSFRLPGALATHVEQISFAEYFFPGTLILILLFTAIFSTISIIEDRREGFLQSVLVAPVPRWSMVLGKLLGGSLIALAQGMLFLLQGLTLGLRFDALTLVAIAAFLFVVSLSLVGLGFVMAWRMDSTQGFHAVMNLFLMPMWLLSGAFFPAADGWLGWVVRLNPLTYAVAGLRQIVYWGQTHAVLPAGLPSVRMCWAVTLVFAGVSFALSWKMAGQRTTGDFLS